MEAIVNVVLPVFAIIFAGYIGRRRNILGEGSSEALNGFVYYFSMPALFLVTLSRVDSSEIFNWPFIQSYLYGMLITFSLVFLIGKIAFSKMRLAERSLQGMAGMFGNTGYMGIPLVMVALGEAAVLPAVIATIINTAVIGGLIIVLVEVDLRSEAGGAGIAKDVFKSLATNPVLISPVIGISLSVMEVSLPNSIASFCDILGAAAGPCALFSIGVFLAGQPLREGIGEISFLTIVKLLIHPLISWVLIVYVFEIKGIWGEVALLMAALPLGATVFVLAQRYDVYVQRSSSATLVTTIVSVITLSVLFPYLSALVN
ncbi:MAG: AEC family transporter [Alphaproteobacteria bacterium]|nr:AEC family transporter [Rhodospirillales bacterium]MCW9044741.1 AEC family transporter [Alphaproteobacteria bacterium]